MDLSRATECDQMCFELNKKRKNKKFCGKFMLSVIRKTAWKDQKYKSYLSHIRK